MKNRGQKVVLGVLLSILAGCLLVELIPSIPFHIRCSLLKSELTPLGYRHSLWTPYGQYLSDSDCVKMAESKEPSIRRHAIVKLAHPAKGSRFEYDFSRHAQDPDPLIRGFVYGKISDTRILMDALDEKDEVAMRAAMRRLSGLRFVPATTKLMGIVESRKDMMDPVVLTAANAVSNLNGLKLNFGIKTGSMCCGAVRYIDDVRGDPAPATLRENKASQDELARWWRSQRKPI